MIKLLLGLFLLHLGHPERDKVLSSCSNVFFILDDNKINLIAYNGKPLNSIYLQDSGLSTQDINQLKKNHKFFITNGNQIEVVSVPHGFVYKSLNDTLRRVDISFAHNMTNYSHVFKKNDTIFKFGGYGYWSNRHFFTYFSDQSHQWEYYPINSNSKTPPGLSRFISLMTKSNEYYVIQGGEVDDINGLQLKQNTNVWRFNFDNKTWIDMGVSNLPKIRLTKRDDNAILYADTSTPYTFLSIDLKNNAYTEYKIKETTFDIFGDHVILKNDSIFNYYNGFVIKKPLEQSYFNDQNSKAKSIYVDSTLLFSGLYDAAILSIIVIFSIIIFIRYQKNQSPRISELGIRYKGVSYHLSKKEKLILVEIIENETVSSQRMYDLVENTELSYPQNNKIKNDTIKKLNKKIEKILGVEDFISSKKLDEDLRVLVYFKKVNSLFFNS